MKLTDRRQSGLEQGAEVGLNCLEVRVSAVGVKDLLLLHQLDRFLLHLCPIDLCLHSSPLATALLNNTEAYKSYVSLSQR